MSEDNAGTAPDSVVDVRDNPARWYEALAGDTVVGSIKYWPHGDRVVFGHTTVDSAWRGKGVAGRPVKAALDDVGDPEHPGPAAVPDRPPRSGPSRAAARSAP